MADSKPTRRIKEPETNNIDMVQQMEDGWILAGLDSERTWSIYLTDEGNMTLSIAMDGTTWSAFGRCMPADRAKP